MENSKLFANISHKFHFACISFTGCTIWEILAIVSIPQNQIRSNLDKIWSDPIFIFQDLNLIRIRRICWNPDPIRIRRIESQIQIWRISLNPNPIWSGSKIFIEKRIFSSKRVLKSHSFTMKGTFSVLKEFWKVVPLQWKELFQL